jgi:hypothetical protein
MGPDLAVLSLSTGSTPLFPFTENIVEKKNLKTKLRKIKDFCRRQ